MRQVSMLALKDFTFAGRQYLAGEYFTASVKHALGHRYRGRAKLAAPPVEREPTPAPEPEVTPAPTPQRRRRYARKDMQAIE